MLLFNPVNDQVLSIPNFTGSLDAALWDQSDSNVFILADIRNFYVFVYTPVRNAPPSFCVRTFVTAGRYYDSPLT